MWNLSFKGFLLSFPLQDQECTVLRLLKIVSLSLITQNVDQIVNWCWSCLIGPHVHGVATARRTFPEDPSTGLFLAPGSRVSGLLKPWQQPFACLFAVITDAWHQLMFDTIRFFLLKTIRCFLAPFRVHCGTFSPPLEMGRILVIQILALIWEINFKEKQSVCPWFQTFLLACDSNWNHNLLLCSPWIIFDLLLTNGENKLTSTRKPVSALENHV